MTIATTPLAFIFLGVLSSKIQPHINAQDVALTKAAGFAHVAIKSIEVVKSFNSQTFEAKQYTTAIKCAANSYLKQAHSNAVQMGFVRIFTLSMFVQGFWYGNRLAATEAVSMSDITTAFWACLLATKAFEDILPQMLILEKGRAAGTALYSLLDQVKKGPAMKATNNQKSPKFCDGDIEVRGVGTGFWNPKS